MTYLPLPICQLSMPNSILGAFFSFGKDSGMRSYGIKAVISLPQYMDMQIHKLWSDIALQRFFPKMTHLCVHFAKKAISLPQYTNTHYKMTFFYLCICFFICSTNRRPNICLILGYQQIHRY